MPREHPQPPRLQPPLTREPFHYASQLPAQNALPTPPLQVPSSQQPKQPRRHVCPTCERPFSTSGHLARHIRVHTGERNHKCPFPGCETRCSRQDNLQQHYRIHLSPGSRRGSGSATRAAMTKAKTSAEQAQFEKREVISRKGSKNTLEIITPSPSSSPLGFRGPDASTAVNYSSPYPEPPDTPPPLAPAIVPTPAGYAYPISEAPGPSSSCSSTPSIPELPISYTAAPARPPVQVDFSSTRSNHSHSPEQSYSSSHGGSNYASPTEIHDHWAYSNHAAQYQQPEPQAQARAHGAPPTPPQHALGTHFNYDYPETYQMQYADSRPQAQHSAHSNAMADYSHAHDSGAVRQQQNAHHPHYQTPTDAPVSRHSISHISPPRQTVLTNDPSSTYAPRAHPHTSTYDTSTSSGVPRYIGASGHGQTSLVNSYASAPVVEQTRQVYADYSTGNSQVPHDYGAQHRTSSLHRYAEQPEGGNAYYAPPGHAYATVPAASSHKSPPPTLPPIQNARVVRDDLTLDSRQPAAHAQPVVDATQTAYSYSYHPHQGAQVVESRAAPSLAGHGSDVPLHQPRPHYGPQQYVAFYGVEEGTSQAQYYRRDSQGHEMAR